MANANFTCVIEAWRSGKTLYGRMHYYRSGSYYYQDSSFPNPTMNLGGTTYTDTDFGNRVRSGIYVGDVYSTTFSRTVSGTGNRTVTWSAGSGQRSDFAGTWSADVYFPEEYSAPTGLSVSLVETYTDGAKFNVSVSSYGNPSSASGRYIEAAILAQNSYGSYYRYKTASNTTSIQITVTNSSYTNGNLAINPNTRYYYGAYATNTQKSVDKVQAQFVTKAPAPTVTLSSVSPVSATFAYSTVADGGYYAKDIEYSVDGGNTWVTAVSGITGGASSGTFTVSGFMSGSPHTLKTRIKTTAGTTLGADVAFVTEAIPATVHLYGSVNGETEEITKLYGSVRLLSDVIGTIDAGGAGNVTAFNSAYFYNTLASDSDYDETFYGNLTLASLKITATVTHYNCSLVYADGTEKAILKSGSPNLAPEDLYNDWGITVKALGSLQEGSDTVSLSPTYGAGQTKKIIKLYGAAPELDQDNQIVYKTKLIYGAHS